MKLLGLQLDLAWENPPANFAHAREVLAAAKPDPGALVVLPELFATGFSMNVGALAEEPGGPTEQTLAALARDFGVFVLGGSLTRAPDGRGRNQAVAFSPTGVELTRYTKLQPYSMGGENQHYQAGPGVTIFACGEAMVAPFICYDLRFPEHFRAAARQRPQIIAVIANWIDRRIAHWTRLLQARAIENQAYVIGVNRCGRDPRYVYPGRSVIVDPHGEILADAGATEGVIRAPADLAALAQYRRDFPVLDDLRPLESEATAGLH